ncbi:hypothetical protein SORBI_3007G201600 [Sorghum bicolor]|uniref:Secreted protein n=1 Tax=Sorghum bicolor TaxID=4558 RepID=A0A1B6PIT5_SORBI|nr:hypothetical protein SORBI_3007G201600 [Sorghum bicolor]
MTWCVLILRGRWPCLVVADESPLTMQCMPRTVNERGAAAAARRAGRGPCPDTHGHANAAMPCTVGHGRRIQILQCPSLYGKRYKLTKRGFVMLCYASV